MSQTIIEIKTSDGLKNSDNSYFQTVFGEPLRLQKGSTVDFLTGFLDLGSQSQNIIEIQTNLKLGIDFYRYENDSGKVPATWNTDAPYYPKRNIYYNSGNDMYDEVEDYYVFSGHTHANPSKTTYGYKSFRYAPSNLPSFLLTRTNVVNDAATAVKTETFSPTLQTAFIIISKGTYTKDKLTQIINDQFNLITGNLTGTDKPAENKVPTTPVDYKIPPNSNSALLKVYQLTYANANSIPGSDLGVDNGLLRAGVAGWGYDLIWNDWFFPIYTTPTDTTYHINEYYLPYIYFYNNMNGFFSGTTKFNIAYDAENDLFFIDYTHSPILDQNQKEVVVFSKSLQEYTRPRDTTSTAENCGYKAQGSMGGILIARLFSNVLDDNFNVVSADNSGFWQDKMGFAFDDASFAEMTANFVNETRTFYYNGDYESGTGFLYPATGATFVFNISYPDPKYLLTNTTNALIPIQWLQQSNYTVNTDDIGMIALANDIPKVFDSIGNRPIYGDANIFNVPNSHYLIEVNISHLINNNYRDRDSSYQIMCVAGKTYTSGTNYIQTFDDGGVQAINIEEDIYIDKIEIRVLNPDKTTAEGLGSNSTFFLKLTQPVIMGI